MRRRSSAEPRSFTANIAHKVNLAPRPSSQITRRNFSAGGVP